MCRRTGPYTNGAYLDLPATRRSHKTLPRAPTLGHRRRSHSSRSRDESGPVPSLDRGCPSAAPPPQPRSPRIGGPPSKGVLPVTAKQGSRRVVYLVVEILGTVACRFNDKNPPSNRKTDRFEIIRPPFDRDVPTLVVP